MISLPLLAFVIWKFKNIHALKSAHPLSNTGASSKKEPEQVMLWKRWEMGCTYLKSMYH